MGGERKHVHAVQLCRVRPQPATVEPVRGTDPRGVGRSRRVAAWSGRSRSALRARSVVGRIGLPGPRLATLMNSVRQRWYVLVAMSIGALMAGLDSSVSNAVLPVIADAQHADAASAQWVVLAYVLVM